MNRGSAWAFAAVAALAILAAPAAFAAGGQSPSPSAAKAADGELATAKKAVEDGDWARAIALLKRVVGRDAKNADAYNLLGYSYRKSGDFELALRHYKTALGLDPEHRGAHEYIGEAYLETGDLGMAEKHLDALDDICPLGCEEHTDLKEAVEAYRKKHGIGG